MVYVEIESFVMQTTRVNLDTYVSEPTRHGYVPDPNNFTPDEIHNLLTVLWDTKLNIAGVRVNSSTIFYARTVSYPTDLHDIKIELERLFATVHETMRFNGEIILAANNDHQTLRKIVVKDSAVTVYHPVDIVWGEI